jgi:SAM domain (Sterile alpha motif)
MDIVVWLRSLGLGRYEAAFRDNEIDETVLPNLTAEDLKDLGVSTVGHRRVIVRLLEHRDRAKRRLCDCLPHGERGGSVQKVVDTLLIIPYSGVACITDLIVKEGLEPEPVPRG